MAKSIIIIGGGIAGYSIALKLARSDYKVTLIEKNRLGGTCLNYGCIPSKIMLRLSENKVSLPNITVFQKSVVRNLSSDLFQFIRLNKITFINSEAEIMQNNRIRLSKTNKIIKYDKLILAVGSQPIIPTALINKKNIITPEKAVGISRLPTQVTVMGGGYIGAELAQAFSSMGTKVTLIEKSNRLLSFLPETASSIITSVLINQKISLITDALAKNYYRPEAVNIVCLGRKASRIPSEIPIAYHEGFIKTDSYFKTNINNIYAIGDCTNGPLMANKAVYDAELLANNLLSHRKVKKNYRLIPVCIFTNPAIAQIGEINQSLSKVKVNFASLSNAYCDNSQNGFLELYINKNRQIVGAVVVNKNATEVLAGLIPIVNLKLTIKKVSSFIYTHPTSSEIIKLAIDKY